MKCHEIKLRLVPFLKGALAADEAEQVQSHLTGCAACAREKAYLEPAVGVLASARLAATEINEGRLLEMVQSQVLLRGFPRLRPYARRWAVVAGAAAAILGGILWIQVSHQPESLGVAPPMSGDLRQGSRLGPDDMGMVAGVVGDARIRRKEEVGWRTAGQRDTLRVGDQLRTAGSEALTLWFTDGTRMRIGPDTHVTFLPPGKKASRPTLVHLERGNASVAVAQSQSQFAVRTPAATATATGTRFALHAAPARTTLAVFSGSVTFSNDLGTVTAAGPVRTTATPDAAPEEPVSIGMHDLLHGGAGTLRDDFDTPPLNEAVWIPQMIDVGVLLAQQDGCVTIQGTRIPNSPSFRVRLLTYFFPRQDFSASVGFRLGALARDGASLEVGWGESHSGAGISFHPDHGYRSVGKGSMAPFGDERSVVHRLRLEYSAGTNLLTGYVDDIRVGDPAPMEAPYFFLSFGATSSQPGVPINVEFDDFEADFAGGMPQPVSLQPSAAPLAARTPGVVLHVGAPDAWDGQTVYNPSVIKRGKRYEMWYAADPPDGSWRQSRIGLAYSDDGITWEKYAGNPVIEEPGMGAPCVLYGDWQDGRGPYYKMWYRRFDPPGMHRRGLFTMLAYATSPDGTHWAKHGVVAGRSPESMPGWGWRITSPSVLYLPDVPGLPAPYLLYYEAEERDVRLALSEDGIHWKPQGPVFKPSAAGGWDSYLVGDGHVVYAGGRFHLFYTGYGRDPRFGSAIGYAVSDDGIHWDRSDRLAAAGSSDAGTLDFGLRQPAPLVDGDTLKIWYTCGPYAGLLGFWGHNIGYAQMPVASLRH